MQRMGELHSLQREQAVLPFVAQDDRQLWLSEPVAAFRAWRRSMKAANGYAYGERSIRQHSAMFATFVAFCEARRVSVLQIDSEQVEAFFQTLSGRPIKHGQDSVRYQEGELPPAAVSTRRRYAQLLMQSFEHLARTRVRPGNPIAPLMKTLDKPEAPGFVSYLSKAQEDAYLAYVQAMSEAHWCAHRDKTLLLLLSASGVSELVHLRVGDLMLTDYEPALQVSQRGLKHAHAAPIASFALITLQAWLKRIEGAAPDAPLFADGRGNAQPMVARDIYLITRGALEASGFGGKQRGPQTLRNTFIRRQLWNGKEPAAVMAWTGLASDRTIKKLLRTLPNRQGISPA
jgi:integrase/recombinase XerD